MLYAHHLGLAGEAIQGARYGLLLTDEEILNELLPKLEQDLGTLARRRGFCSHLGRLAGEPVVLLACGFGCPAIALGTHELVHLGLTTLILFSTADAIQDSIEVGEVLIVTGAVRLEGSSTAYAPIEFPAVAHGQVVQALQTVVLAEKRPHHLGVTATTDSYYPGQERYELDGKHVLNSFRSSMLDWKRLGVLGYEMEVAPLLTMGLVMGIRTGSLLSVVVNRTRQEQGASEKMKETERSVAPLALLGLKHLIERDKTG